MKFFLFGMLSMLILFVLLFVYLNKVGSNPRHNATGPNDLYKEWFTKTATSAVEPDGPEQESAWIKKVEAAFTPFTPEQTKTNFPLAYAEDLYFRDAFHTYTDFQIMLDYMVKSAEMSQGVTFEFSPVVRNGIDFHLPWVMILPSKEGGDPQRSLGISHLRFNAEGKVIFHQDYWDSADVLVPKVPIANGLIELVRRRF
jgi:hypothetical protein